MRPWKRKVLFLVGYMVLGAVLGITWAPDWVIWLVGIGTMVFFMPWVMEGVWWWELPRLRRDNASRES